MHYYVKIEYIKQYVKKEKRTRITLFVLHSKRCAHNIHLY